MTKLTLALPHAEELRRVAAHQSSPDPENLQRLLTSSLLLANAYATAGALIKLLVNRANRRYASYILSKISMASSSF